MEPAHMTIPVRSVEPPALTLYDLSERMLDVEAFIHDNEQAIIDAGGDLDAIPGLAELLDSIPGKFTEKLERVVLFIQNRTAIMKARKDTAAQFAHLAKVDERTVESLKAYLVLCQRRANWTKVETAKCRATIVRNSQVTVERGKDTRPLGVLHANASVETGQLSEHILDVADYDSSPFLALRLHDPDGVEFIAAQVRDLIIEERTVSYSLNRDKILERWHKAYDTAVDAILAEHEELEKSGRGGARLTGYELDMMAHRRANADPVLRLLGVTVTQGYHVRIK